MRRLEPIGKYIQLSDTRNSDLSVTNLVGLTVEKRFIPSVANVIGTDLSKYKVITHGQFACSLMQVSRDGKMPVAMYKGEPAIMSPAYPIFEITDENKLMPEYLHMYLSRPEFDREAVFRAVGGVRGSLDWEDFIEMKIPVPNIDEQRKIVAEYQTIEKRIENNNRLICALEQTAQNIYRHTFVESIDPENLPEGWKIKNIFDVSNVVYGFPFDSNLFCDNSSFSPVVRIRDIVENRTYTYTSETADNKYNINDGDILIGMDGNFHMTIWAGGYALQNQRIVKLTPKVKNIPLLQLFYLLKPQIKALEKSIEGTTVAHLGDKDLRCIEMIVGPDDIQNKISHELYIILKNILSYKKENLILNKALPLILSKLS